LKKQSHSVSVVTIALLKEGEFHSYTTFKIRNNSFSGGIHFLSWNLTNPHVLAVDCGLSVILVKRYLALETFEVNLIACVLCLLGSIGQHSSAPKYSTYLYSQGFHYWIGMDFTQSLRFMFKGCHDSNL